MGTTQSKVTMVRDGLRAAFAERDDEIEGMIAAALAGEHVVLVGPPGTGKSALARAFSAAIGGRFWEILLTRFSTPEEVFGPFKLSALQADRFSRNMSGRLPECDVAFVDEIFKAGPGLLNSLLSALNERVVHDDGAAIAIPLKLAIGASNEYPTSDELGALWDRFLVRFDVAGIKSPDNQRKLLLGQLLAAPTNVLTVGEWASARAEVEAVKISPSVADSLLSVVNGARGAGSPISDRRTVKLARLVRAVAWLDGADEVDTEHFGILEHALWNTPEQRPAIAAVVATHVSPKLHEARRVYDAVTGAVGPLLASEAVDQQARALTEIKKAGTKVKTIMGEMREGSRSRREVNDMLKKLAGMHQDAMKKATAAWGIDDSKEAV